MAELDTTVAGRHADGSPYNADGALLVTITNDEPAPRGPTPSDGNYSFDGVLQFHDDAETLSTADYSTASFAETETLPDGQVVGMIGEHSVPIPRTNEKYYPPPVEDSEQTTAPAAATATAPVASEADGSIARDVLRGVSTGAVKASNDLTGALSMILGAPSDITKSLLETFGFDAGEGILGSDNIEKNMNSFSSWVVENIPGVSDVDEIYTAFNKEKANTGWVQNFSDGIGRFGIGAVTGPVQAVRLLGVANPIVRGLAWGGLTDFIQGAGSAKDEQTMLGELGKGLSSLTGVEEEAWAKGVLSVFAKHETNSEITRRFKMTLDGFVIGGAVDLVLTGLIRAVKKVPWRSMPKPDDMDVPQMSGQPDGGGDVAAALPAPVKVDDAVPVPEVQTRPATDLDPQGFFSAVSRAVDAIPMEKGSGAQMRAMIAKGEGVKAEEMAWTGLDDFLAGKKSVTKAEIKEFTEANQVEIIEIKKTVSAQDADYQYEAVRDDLADGVITQKQAASRSREIQASVAKYGPGYSGMELTTPGGTNYREVVLMLPRRPLEGARYAIKDENGINMPSNAVSRQDAIAEAGGDADRVVEMPAPGALDPNFNSVHFPEKNILAHVRTMDRMEGNRKVLFIEEIQSDWWSQGQKRGIRSQATEKAHKSFTGYAEELAKKYELNPHHNLAMYKTIAGITEAEIKKYTDLQTAAYGSEGPVRIAGMQGKPSGVASAPFIDTKDKFVALALRRIIRDAVDKGYDEVSWTSGAMQNARYSNTESVNKASVGPAIDSPDGRVVILQDANGADVFFGTVNKNGIILTDEKFKGKSLESIVGKPLAEKLMNADVKVDPNKLLSSAETARLDKLSDKRIAESIDGLTPNEFDDYINLISKREDSARPTVPVEINLNIKVGGKFHRDLYDKIIPKQAEKIIRKFDKSAKVEKSQIGLPSSDRYSIDRGDGTTFETDAEGADQAVIAANGDTSIATKINDAEEIWTISITPKMRDSVLKKGVPLFSAAGAAAATGAAMQNEKQPASERVF